MAAKGALLHPKDLAVGDLVQCRDPKGHWYNARVAKRSGRGAGASVYVRYVGFGPSRMSASPLRKAVSARGLMRRP